MSYEQILVTKVDGRCRITLNRPDKRNALSLQMQQELHDALWDADLDKSVHAVLLKGAGKDFCAGYDLQEKLSKETVKKMKAGEIRSQADPFWRQQIDDDMWFLEQAQRLRMTIFDMHKPVICQVQGNCLAGGTDLAFLCDIVIAADDAQIGFPPVRDFGVGPNQMLLYHMGPQWAKRLVLTGDAINGKDAASVGLVLKSVPLELLEQECEGLCDRMALIDPDLLAGNKRIVNLGLEQMGARTLQRLAAETDARGHRAGAVKDWMDSLREHGPSKAFKLRNGPFGAGKANVFEPDEPLPKKGSRL